MENPSRQYYAQTMRVTLLCECWTMIDGMAFAERLKAAREAARMTKEDLARAIGVTGGAIGHLESGRSKSLSMDHIFDCAEALGVNARWLATGAGPMTGLDIHEAPSSYAIRIAKKLESLPNERRKAIETLLEP